MCRSISPPCRILQVDNRSTGVNRLKTLLGGQPQVAHLVAVDAVEAIFIARTRQLDMVLFDSAVPGMGAADMARILKEDPGTQSICVVAIGNGGGEEYQECDAALPEEFELVQLYEIVDQYV